jgi:hypothetical protein
MRTAPSPIRVPLHSSLARIGTSKPLIANSRGYPVKNPSGTTGRDICPDLSKERMVRLLWAAFLSRSENELAEKASRYLGVTERTVRNYLRRTHEAKLRHAIMLGALVGYERFLGIVFGED